MKKKILVAGGAGFLGAHLCEKLLEYEHDVVSVDNLFSGSKKNIGGKPDVKLDEGLSSTIDYFSKIISSSLLYENPERALKYSIKSVSKYPE